MRAGAPLSFSRSSGPIESKTSTCWGSFNSPKVTFDLQAEVTYMRQVGLWFTMSQELVGL